MSVLVYIETGKGKVKKASLEATNYGAHIAQQMGTTVTAIAFNAEVAHLEEVGKAGAKKILNVKGDQYKNFDPVYLAAALEQAAKAEGSKVIITSFDVTGKALAPRLSGKLKAGMVAGADRKSVV